MFIIAYRPGADQDPSIDHSLPLASVLSVALALLYPQALVPIGAAISLYVAIIWWQNRRMPRRLVRWALAVIIPAIPIAVYYVMTVLYNPAMAEWNQQNVTPSPVADPAHLRLRDSAAGRAAGYLPGDPPL